MVVVNFRDTEFRYASISSRAELSACITWLLGVLDDMELKGRDNDTILDLKDYDDPQGKAR